MSLSLSAEQKNLRSIFDIQQQYVIPSYQRGYSWDYDECYQMYNDIMDAYHENQEYFIGNLVIAKSDENKDRLEVVDGQQRLTTLLLFFKFLFVYQPKLQKLRDCYIRKDIYSDHEDNRIRSEVFEVNDEENLALVLHYDRNDFDSKMEDFLNSKGEFLVHKIMNIFERNALFFYSWIEYYVNNGGDLDAFIRFLFESVYLLPIELNGKNFEEANNKALKIFETLNNRGKSLNDADIFKGKLYEKARKNNEAKAFIEQWKDLRNRCETSSTKIDDLFRYYSHIIRGRENKTTSEINIRDFFIEEKYSPFKTKNYDEVLQELFDIIEVVEFINKEKNGETELAKWLQLLEIYTNQFPKIALVVYLYVKNINTQNTVETVNFFKKLIRLVYFNGSTSVIKFKIFNIIRDISIDRDIDDFIEKNIPIERFDYLGLLKNGYALLAFYLIEDKALKQTSFDKIINYKDKKYLVDWSDEQISDVVDMLGNIIVLDISKKNITIDKKKDYLKKSNIEEVRLIADDMDNISYEKLKKRDIELKERLIKFFKGEI